MRYVYNKLVRDKIPENISLSGRKCNYKILNDKDYLQELDNKLFEEDIIPLGTVSYDSLMEEIKTTPKAKMKQNKASEKKMSQGKDSEEKTK